MTTNPNCTTTGSGTTIRDRDDISPRPDRAGGGLNPYSYVMNNPVQWIDLLGLAHTSGKWKDCGKGCRIRIDGDAVGDGRHLHWECKNGVV